MAFSGTISQTVFNTGKVIDSAMRRCKIPTQKITSEMIDTASSELYLFLSALANQNMPLWCLQKQVYPIAEGVADLVLVNGTVDVLNANLRTLFNAGGVETVEPLQRTFTFPSPTMVTTVGTLMPPLTVPETPVFARSDDGLVWTEVPLEVGTLNVGMVRTWYDLESTVPSMFFRVIGVIPTVGVYVGNTPSEIPLSRLNRQDYVNLPNKSFLSNRPLQYWLDRQVREPIMRLWPTPNLEATASQIVVWAHRHIMDVGTMTQEIEVPQRWYDAVVAGLAARLAYELPEVDAAMIGILEPKAAQTLMIAQQEERDNSTKRIAPDFSAYTA